MANESSPLLQFPGMGGGDTESLGNQHSQFCHLVGIKPFTHPPGQRWQAPETSLYYRATQHRRAQGFTYLFTATLTNGLLLFQVVLGAALTALGASDSSRVLITVFGAMNTIIAGLIAFLRSRGQPVRARMFRDELDRIVNEIENSAVMWHGVSKGVHGYDAIDTNVEVTVRSEVARLTRLYDRAVKNSTMNDPDNYAAGMTGDPYSAALRARPGTSGVPASPAPAVQAPPAAVPPIEAAAPLVPIPAADPDESPASKAPQPKPKEPEVPKGDDKTKDTKTAPSTDTEAPKGTDAAGAESARPSEPADAKASPTDQPSAPKTKDPSDTGKAEVSNDPITPVQSQKHSEDTSQ